MGRFHAQALSRGQAFRLVGVVDPLEPQWADVPWRPSLEAALGALEPEAVIVATPTSTHEAVAQICLEAGCHVLLEKPLCPTGTQARNLAHSFQKAGKVLFGGHSERFHPVFQAMAEVASDRPLQAGHAIRIGPRPFREVPEGLLADLAIHDLDLALRLFGSLRLVDAVRAEDLTEALTLRSPDGPVVVRCGYQEGRIRRWELHEEGARWEADFLGRTLVRFGEGQRDEYQVGGDDPLEAEHRAFRKSMEGKGSGDELVFPIEAIDLVEQAQARLGGLPLEG